MGSAWTVFLGLVTINCKYDSCARYDPFGAYIIVLTPTQDGEWGAQTSFLVGSNEKMNDQGL